MAASRQTGTVGWAQRLAECLPLYGHRNWIVVADAAYPAQAGPGIETIVADSNQIATVRRSWMRSARANTFAPISIRTWRSSLSQRAMRRIFRHTGDNSIAFSRERAGISFRTRRSLPSLIALQRCFAF